MFQRIRNHHRGEGLSARALARCYRVHRRAVWQALSAAPATRVSTEGRAVVSLVSDASAMLSRVNPTIAGIAARPPNLRREFTIEPHGHIERQAESDPDSLLDRTNRGLMVLADP